MTGNFKHLPEPFHIHVVKPAERIARAYREGVIIRSDMSPFLLNSEDVLTGLLVDSSTGAMTQSMQTVMVRSDETYSGGRSCYALAESVKDVLGYQYTIPTHQGRGVEQIYIPILIEKHEQKEGLGRSKMAAFSNYFFDTTQGHSQVNGCIVRNVYVKETFDTDVRCDFRSNFDLEGLERGTKEVGPNNVPCVAATITSNPVDGQPVSLANLKMMYSIVEKYDIPVVMDSTRSAENTYFIKQYEVGYEDWIIEQITCGTYRYAGMLAISAKKDIMVPMSNLLCMGDDSFFDVYAEYGTLCVVQEGSPTYGGLEGSAMERLAVGLYDNMNLNQLAYRIAQIQYLIDGLEEIGVVYQQADGHAALVDAGKLLPHIPADQFLAQALACELYKAAGIRAVKIGSSLLGCDPKTGKRLPCPAELLYLTIPHVTYTQTHMGFIIEALKHMKESAANIKGLTFAYEPKVLHHFTARLKEAQLILQSSYRDVSHSFTLHPQ